MQLQESVFFFVFVFLSLSVQSLTNQQARQGWEGWWDIALGLLGRIPLETV